MKRSNVAIVLAVLSAQFVACATVPKGVQFHERGKASWYGAELQGHKTASGERFDMGKLTAAHRTLPFGTGVCVRNLATNRQVVVRINDRGPFVAGRVIDLTPAAAQALGFSGLAQVTLDVVGRS